MNLDHPYTSDIVKRVRLMASIALLDARRFLSGDHLVHHLEVHHAMAWRWLMALGAFG